jgi:hypothetical protein
MKHLRQQNDFRQAFQYSGNIQPLLMGPGNMLGAMGPMGPLGMAPPIVYEGVMFFESNNMPTQTVNNIVGRLGIFFGMQSVGVATGGMGPRILINQDDDFGRFIILIWQLYGDFQLLNGDFVTVARTYAA